MASLPSTGQHAPAPAGLLDHRLVYVSGKGGVGKSTVAAALGLAGVRARHRVVVAEVARRTDVEHVVLSSGADHVSIDPDQALEDYVVDQLPLRALADLLVSSRTFAYLAGAAPGLRELVTAGTVWELGQDQRRDARDPSYDLVVVDAPATGHGVAVLSAPRTFAAAARVGPIARQAETIASMLSDPSRTAVVAVTSAEELPVNETLALREALRAEVGLDVSLVVANGLLEPSLTATERARLERSADRAHPAVGVALAWDARAHSQLEQLERLREGLRGEVPIVEVPFAVGDRRDVGAADALEVAL
jgi:anion-transporting  ArsA/GET3 family ATPase